MSAVKLPAEQYQAYDEAGFILTQRATRAHTLSKDSMHGPGVCVVLRTGEELDTGDGIGVELTLTDDNLRGLGYLTENEVALAISDLFPPEALMFGDDSKERGKAIRLRTQLGMLATTLGVKSPYQFEYEAKLRAAADKAKAEEHAAGCRICGPRMATVG